MRCASGLPPARAADIAARPLCRRAAMCDKTASCFAEDRTLMSTAAAIAPAPSTTAQAWRDITWTARDGLRLYARHYPAPSSHLRPVLCLAGLTRNSRDFHDLALALSRGPTARNVYALDYRGRGLSAHDPDWRNYAVPIEMFDVQDFITAEGIAGAAIVGTSRGGLIAMVLAAVQPTVLGPVVLNDIGPIIEYAGLLRISGYIGKATVPLSWEQATRTVREIWGPFFPGVPEDRWDYITRQLYMEKDGRPAAGYDPKLMKSFSLADGRVPELWPQFLALSRAPVFVIRGELSDLLSAATVAEMVRRHPRCRAATVPGQGHAPLLQDPPTIGAISAFLAEHDH